VEYRLPRRVKIDDYPASMMTARRERWNGESQIRSIIKERYSSRSPSFDFRSTWAFEEARARIVRRGRMVRKSNLRAASQDRATA
jgi:hypothetical protein